MAIDGNRPDKHTPDHDQWDQGGFCNNLVTDDDGCGTVCGYRKPRVTQPGEILTPLEAVVRLVEIPPHFREKVPDGKFLRIYMQDWTKDTRVSEVLLSQENRIELAIALLEGLE